jgi:hypothetical protein
MDDLKRQVAVLFFQFGKKVAQQACRFVVLVDHRDRGEAVDANTDADGR